MNFRSKTRPDGWPTRADMQHFSPAEKAIWDAQQAVEAAGASIALTDAAILLGKARDRVADHVEGNGNEQPTPEVKVVCPQCNSTENKPYLTAENIPMRACHRCLIQWRDITEQPTVENHPKFKALAAERQQLEAALREMQTGLEYYADLENWEKNDDVDSIYARVWKSPCIGKNSRGTSCGYA